MFRKILLTAVILVVLLSVVGISLTIGWRPFIGPKTRQTTSRQFERTPPRLARGKYLATGIADCTGCHSIRDWKNHGAPVVPGNEFSGQDFPLPGLPGRVVASNITPDVETGAGGWTDDQLARAIREGIGHDGRVIFPIMPYGAYKKMSDEDLASVVVYLRSLPPIRHSLARTEIKFPVNYLIRSAPEPVTAPVASPSPTDQLKYGEYLVTIGGCAECHTPQVRGQEIPGMNLAGGNVMNGPWGNVVTANITPDASGIGYYDEALFLQVMRTGYVKARELKSIMPYEEYKNLTDDDLKAMYAYMRTLQPVKHRVDNTLPPTDCKLCRQKHGAGDQN
jgi:mono/diheme cytochrome c family protein